MTESAPEPPQGLSAYDRLLDEIRTGRLLPGARLRETELAERLGISRTPVREAIRRLEADGLVEHVPRQGAAVRRLVHAEVMELYEMRAVLEGTAGRLAARAASRIELDELSAINAAMTAAGTDPVQVARLNRQFHAALLNAARNRFLTRAMAAMQRTLMILGPSTLADGARAAAAAAEHAALIDALLRHDAEAAERAMRAHIEAAQRERLRLLREEDAYWFSTDDDGGRDG